MKKIYLIICISSLALMLFGCSDKNSRNGGEESVTGSAAVLQEDDAIEEDHGASAENEETADVTSSESDEQTDTASEDAENESINPENTDRDAEVQDDKVPVVGEDSDRKTDQAPAPQPVQEDDGNTESVAVQPAVVDQPVDVPASEALPDPEPVIAPGQESDSQSSSDTDEISPVQVSESSGNDNSEPQLDTSDDDTSEKEPETDENGCYMTEDGNWVCPVPGR